MIDRGTSAWVLLTAAGVIGAGQALAVFAGPGPQWSTVSLQAGIALGSVLLAARWTASAREAAGVARAAFARRIEQGEPLAEAEVDAELEPVVRAVAAIREIASSERERAVRDARNFLEMLEVTPNAIACVSADGRLRYANPATRELFALERDPTGMLPVEVLRLAELQDALDGGLVGDRREHPCAFGTHDLLVRGYPMADGAMVVINDVTRFREVERARTDFVANVSHELRTPVTAIAGYAETLLAEADQCPPDIVPMLETIDRNARRLSNLFEDLLKLHRIESRRKELPLVWESLQPLLEEAVVTAADSAARKGQTFALACPDELAGWANAEALMTIVSNLASNAVNYTNAKGSITVRARATAAGPMVEVVDTGIGIDPVHHERVFERFYRVDEARSRRAGGTGLGLAIVKHLCLASKCQVSLESEPGRGTTFRIQLPRSPS